jgi:hypothetical protein
VNPSLRLKSMTTNPYASPADATETPAGNPLVPVAVTLLMLSVLWMLACALVIASFRLAASNAKEPDIARMYQMNSGSMLICLVYQFVLISGAISMLRKSSYAWSCATCWLACVPVLGPCYVLAIPVGIWGLLVLRRSTTKALFPPTPPSGEPVLGVAIALITLAILGMVFALAGTNYALTMLNDDDGQQMFRNTLLVVAVIFLYQIGLLYGASRMIGTGSYRGAFITCCLACVPILGPCYFLAIPVGIWGLMVLRRPEVRAGWEESPTEA